jgi:uncharacterized membrane protein
VTYKTLHLISCCKVTVPKCDYAKLGHFVNSWKWFVLYIQFEFRKVQRYLYKRKEMNKPSHVQTTVCILLGLLLVLAGTGHLTFSRNMFSAQVPSWLPMNPDLVVVLSGIVEILLGASLILLVKQRIQLGWIVAAFFVLVFPGNIAQLVDHRNAFGLDSDLKRWFRLPFQFILIFLALWSTGAWQKWRSR